MIIRIIESQTRWSMASRKSTAASTAGADPGVRLMILVSDAKAGAGQAGCPQSAFI